MTITVRGRSRVLLSAAIVLACAPHLFGADWKSPDARTYAQDAKGEDKATVFHLDRPEQLDVIVEFREAPVLVSHRARGLRVASASVDALSSRFAQDLARIEGEAPGRIAAQGRTAGAIRHRYRMAFAGASATVRRSSVAAIRALPYVRAVHEDRKVEMHLARSLPFLGVPQVWQQHGRRGKGIVVAIIDSGIDYNHWALGEGFGPGHKVAGGWDIFNDDADPMDDNGHGTHVAGIVAANHSSLTGVAPEATLLAYKVLGADGFGTQSLVLAGVERAIDPNGDGDPSDHPDVVNMSLGGPLAPDDPVIAAVERGVAAGIVFSLSAGNSAALAGLGSPALAPSAITVAASDLEDWIAPFSTGGPPAGTWGLKPEIAAPGVNIVSSITGNRTRSASGTSMAAPHVAGIAALLLEEHPDWTPHDVKMAIVSTAKAIVGREARGVKTNGNFLAFAGAGRIDPVRAIEATILPSKAAAAFGMVASRGTAWTASTTVTYTNRGASSETLTVQPPAVPEGVTLTVAPQTFTLAPGASAELQLTLEVPASVQANDSDVLVGGLVDITGTNTALRLPWMILKADTLQVTYTGDDEFQIYMSNGPDPAVVSPVDARTYVALIPYMKESDIMLLTPETETTDARMILRERQPLDGFTQVTLSPDDAPYRIVFDGVDERGVRLDQLSPDVTGRLYHRFELPSVALIELTSVGARRALRISNFRETRFRTYEMRLSGTDRYFAEYKQLRNVKQDEVLAITPQDWASQKIRAVCREPECTLFVGAGLGSPLGFTYYSYPPGTTEFTLHLTEPADPARYDFRAYAFVREKGFSFDPNMTVNPWTFVSNSLRNVNGRFSTSPFGFVTDAEYYPPDRNTPLVLGDGPAIMRIATGPYFVRVEPFGSNGEFFGDEEARDVDVDIQRLDGPILIDPIDKSQYLMPRATPGTYRLDVTDDYTVSGRPGHMTQTSNYDTHATFDGPPTLTFLRIENGIGVASTTVAAGSRSRVVFAARQSLMAEPASWIIRHSRLVDPAATQAWWRPHGSIDWLPLDVKYTGEDYERKWEATGPPGALFTASLAPATAATGEVDLKLFLKNSLGHTTEVIYEPAFVVGQPAPPRRRAMR